MEGVMGVRGDGSGVVRCGGESSRARTHHLHRVLDIRAKCEAVNVWRAARRARRLVERRRILLRPLQQRALPRLIDPRHVCSRARVTVVVVCPFVRGSQLRPMHLVVVRPE